MGLYQQYMAEEAEYIFVKTQIQEALNHTGKAAGVEYLTLRWRDVKHLSPEQLLGKGRSLLTRTLEGARIAEEGMQRLLRAWLYNLVPDSGKEVLDRRRTDVTSDVLKGIREFQRMERDSRGRTRFNQPREKHGERDGGCFTCGSRSHRQVDCPAGMRLVKPKVEGERQGLSEKTVTCYTCGNVGHKSPACPNKQKSGAKEAVPKAARRAWDRRGSDTTMSGAVGNLPAEFLLDSGATVTIVYRRDLTRRPGCEETLFPHTDA